MKKLLPLLFTLIILVGCSSKKYYTLGNNLNIHADTTYTKPIDIVTVNIPKYLQDHILVRQVTPYRIELLDKAQWLTPMKKRLTNILIDYLQKSMNNPNVYLYPWNSNKNSYKRVYVTIKRFIAYKNSVYLEANYKIYNLKSKKSDTKLFNTTIPTKEDIDSMMHSMEIAYLQLAEKIKSDIINK